MRTDFYVDSLGEGQLHCCRWTPEGSPRAIVQLVHGIADYLERYDPIARYLCSQGYLVVGEDHMGHGHSRGGTQGYFAGGWFRAVEDTHRLMQRTREEYPGVPYILFGHSMGSFMTRTILIKYSHSGPDAAVICGTCWQPLAIMPFVTAITRAYCRLFGERTPKQTLQNMVFSGYNARISHPRTPYDWVNSDDARVEEYAADPLCGFTATCGLLRDMMIGVRYIEEPENLARMKPVPVLFIAGEEDPVGAYGKGIRNTVTAFQKAGITDITCHIYPGMRHEILNEPENQKVFTHISTWLAEKISPEGEK